MKKKANESDKIVSDTPKEAPKENLSLESGFRNYWHMPV